MIVTKLSLMGPQKAVLYAWMQGQKEFWTNFETKSHKWKGPLL